MKNKFRAWLKRTKEFVVPTKINFDDTISIYYNSSWYGSSDFELDQFTGAYDKNGTEIYEHDIIEIKRDSRGLGTDYDTHIQAEVVWNDIGCCFEFQYDSYGNCDLLDTIPRNDHPNHNSCYDSCEVVGHAHTITTTETRGGV